MLKYYDELDHTNSMEVYLPFSGKTGTYTMPNSYFINSRGYLFNCFGEYGHKEENLIYTYYLIKKYYNDGKYKDLTGYHDISLQEVLIDAQEAYKRIIETNSITKQDVYDYAHLNFCDLNDPLLIKLIIGAITSKMILLQQFIELANKSKDKKSDLDIIVSQSNDNINDILVRYCGFHKVEAKEKRAITTSSLNLNNFINYFENGWKINLVPPISVCNENADVHRMVVVDNFLNKNPQYSDKIKIRKA